MKHLSFVLGGGIMLFIPTIVAHASFSDVLGSHPYAEAIEYVQNEGIVNGYNDGTFRPDQTINRAEFIKIIEESIPDAEEGVGLCPPVLQDTYLFSDVSGDEWFALYACMAKGRGLVKGYADGGFHPAAAINFVEAAKIIYQANHLDKRGIATSSLEYNPWYREYVRFLEEEGALPDSITSFDQKITRGEMAQMIYSVRYLTKEEETCRYSPDLSCMRDIQRRVDAQAIGSALSRYYEIHKKFPFQLGESFIEICTADAIKKGDCTGPILDLSFLVEGGFLTQIPVDPSLFGNDTKHTGYLIFRRDHLMGVNSLHGEMINVSALMTMFEE